MEIAGIEIKEQDRIYLTGEQMEKINECLNYLNGYIEGILLIGKGCFLTDGHNPYNWKYLAQKFHQIYDDAKTEEAYESNP